MQWVATSYKRERNEKSSFKLQTENQLLELRDTPGLSCVPHKARLCLAVSPGLLLPGAAGTGDTEPADGLPTHCEDKNIYFPI